jgi:hypothetical protein
MLRLRPYSNRHKTWSSLQSLQARASLFFPEPASKGATPSALKPEDHARSVSRESVAIVASTYGFARWCFHQRKNPN